MPAAVLTNRLCASTVTERTKFFDTELPGFYADISPKGVCKLYYKFYNSVLKKQQTEPVGVFDPQRFDVGAARRKVKVMTGEVAQRIDIKQRNRAKVEQHAKLTGVTFRQAANEYIEECMVPELKDDGEMRATKESYKQDISLLKRPLAAFGSKIISEIRVGDIRAVIDVLKKAGKKATAGRVRIVCHSVFRFAAEREYVQFNPCTALPKQGKRGRRDRFLTEDEIRTLWHGLDRPDLPVDRHLALALKLILCTGLRPGEVISARRNEIGPLSIQKGGDGRIAYRIPLARVKKRRVIIQPLNSLAMEIIGELMAMPTKNDLLFPLGPRGATMTHHALSDALLGRTWNPRTDRKTVNKKVYRRDGIIEFLGMDKFKPHDLRRTAMTQLGLDAVTNNTGITNQDIGRILDHQPEDANGATVIYNVAEQVKQTKLRRPTLEHLDRLLRGIIGESPDNVVKLPRKAA